MEIVDVKYLGTTPQYQEYANSDLSLVNKAFITPTFGGPDDYIELFIKDIAGTVIGSNYNVTKYNIGDNANPTNGTTSTIYLDPEADARDQGFNRGSVNVKYNFFRKFILSSPNPNNNFWIKEVSTSRTEIKCARQDLSDLELSAAFNEFNGTLGSDAYYPDFLLDFGNDVQIIAVNAVYVQEGDQGYVIFKLYEPLPDDLDVKSTFWVVYQVAEPAEFNVTINVAPELVVTSTPLRGPNYKVNVTDRIGKTTPYYNYASLFLTSVTSSYQQLKSMMDEKGIQINTDYTNFENFIHFSSATERLYNFTYKVQQIESASAELASTSLSSSRVVLQSEIDNTIEKFDGYEYYLYFSSASAAWPKSSTTQPYTLYSATSSQAQNWLGGISVTPTATTMSMYYSASYYDDQNKDWLVHSTPAYLRDDTANAPYLVFLDMIGQHFDNIWIYIKDLSNRYSAENNPFVGVSMDQVGEALKSFGINLYTNTNVSDNIYYSLLGINQTGSALPVTSSGYSQVNIASSSLYPLSGNAYLSSSLSLPPFGEELIKQYVTTFITASAGVTSSFATLPAEQLKNEVYKRLYHNLAYLLKTKGTDRGVKALITTYGIPEDILSVNEYGGYNIYEVAGIQELFNENVSTGSVLEISSSLLSPYTTLQYYQNNTDKTSPDVEVGFSPTDAINAAITSSGIVTASNQPGYFNIMQYIGAPNLQYSSSYTPLVTLENTFFDATFTGNAQTGLTRFNVWDFIRSIKYYNNSLFKMIRDFVPARANLSTGIVVRSHILERNKYARHEPTVTFEDQAGSIGLLATTGSDGSGILYNTSYTASVPIQYSSASNYFKSASGYVSIVSNTGVENYTGEFSGSTIFASYNEFPQIDVSSYQYPWTSSVPPSEHGGQNIMFTTYSINYLTNNVTSSVISQRFLDLDYSSNQFVPVNYGLVTQSLSQSLIIGPISQSQQPYSMYAQLQDYNYNLRRSMIPRYSGSYLSGLYYNQYTGQNPTYSGDISYGNDPVINYYSSKLGLFTQVQSSSFIPGTVNASLAYLADVSGGLFELNQNNINWQDVQNLFVAGDSLTIKQFDNKKYSNQVGTDGIKAIYSSGYNYTPELYFNTSSDSKIYFQYAGGSAVGTFTAVNGPNFFITGSAAAPSYPVGGVTSSGAGISKGYIYNIFNSESFDISNYYTAGNTATSTFPKYQSAYAGTRNFTANLEIAVQFAGAGLDDTNQQEATYTLSIKKNGTTLPFGSTTETFIPINTPGYFTNGQLRLEQQIQLYSYSATGFTFDYDGPFEVSQSNGSGGWTIVGISKGGSAIAGRAYNYSYYSNGQLIENAYGLFAYDITDGSGSGVTLSSYVQTIGGGQPPTLIYSIYGSYNSPPVTILSSTLTLDVATEAASFVPSDVVTFELLSEVTASNNNFTASVSVGNLTVAEQTSQGSFPFATASLGSFIQSLSNPTQGTGLITFSSDLSNYLNYQMIPYFTSGSPGVDYSSSLYNKYGDVNEYFTPLPNDKVILTDAYGISQDLTVYTSSFNGSNYTITTIPGIPNNLVTTPSAVQQFLLLRRYDDEQNVILTFNKNPGATSYGFLIPGDISPQITNNINSLQAAVQSQLLSTQANSSA